MEHLRSWTNGYARVGENKEVSQWCATRSSAREDGGEDGDEMTRRSRVGCSRAEPNEDGGVTIDRRARMEMNDAMGVMWFF